MIDVILQTNKSEENRLNKSLVDIKTVKCLLKDNTSIVSPSLIIEGTLTDFYNCNYCTIGDFGRKYFVTNITSLNNNRLQIDCKCDVLTTYADEIRACTGIIRKNEKTYNLYLNDGTFKTYQNPHILTKQFPSGFSTQEFILAVAGS